MDETPLYFDMPSSILACTAAGHMLPPMIIFKGKRVLKNLRIPPGVVVELQQKGWNDTSLMLVWIQKVLLRYTKKQHALIVWDTFTGHMTEEVAEKLQKSNITVVVIPGGCTSKIQPLDVCLNEPLKCYCRNQWMEYIQKQVATLEPGERPKTAAEQQVIDWVVDSNKLLNSKRGNDHQVLNGVWHIKCIGWVTEQHDSLC